MVNRFLGNRCLKFVLDTTSPHCNHNKVEHGRGDWLVTYDLLLETSKVYSGFLNDGVLLLNVWFSQLQVRMVNVLSGTSKRVCLTTIHVLFSSSHTQFLLYVSLIAQLCIYISKCPCPCYWPCGLCGRTYKISCKSQICI